MVNTGKMFLIFSILLSIPTISICLEPSDIDESQYYDLMHSAEVIIEKARSVNTIQEVLKIYRDATDLIEVLEVALPQYEDTPEETYIYKLLNQLNQIKRHFSRVAQ